MVAENSILGAIADAVREGKTEEAVELCRQALSEEMPPRQVIDEGLSAGMHVVGDLYERHIFFLPELLMAAEAMHAGIDVLIPALKSADDVAEKETVVMGVVEGDVHEIGKNLVGVMLETAGYRVVDLGYDVSPQRFTGEVKERGAQILALSTMMTTTLPNMRRTVEMALTLNPLPLVIVGGAPLSPALAEDMGAHGYEDNAAKTPGLVQRLLG
jgi:dimethylamine corrinoid protein